MLRAGLILAGMLAGLAALHAEEPWMRVPATPREIYILPATEAEELRGFLRGEFYHAGDILEFWTPNAAQVRTADGEIRLLLHRSLDHVERMDADMRRHPETATPRARAWLQDKLVEINRRLGAYKAQFFGVSVNGRPLLAGNYFDSNGLSSFPDFTRRLVMANDGGARFWAIEYDPVTHTAENFQVNGP